MNAELALVRSLIDCGSSIAFEVAKVITREHFQDKFCADLYDAIIEYYREHINDKYVDVTILSNEYIPKKKNINVVGMAEVLAFTDYTTAYIEEYVRILDERLKKDKLKSELNKIIIKLETSPVQDVKADLLKLINDTPTNTIRTPSELIIERIEGRGDFGLLTGIDWLDKYLEPWYPGQLIVIGAGTGVGKTALALQIAYNLAVDGKGVYYASLEMSGVETACRIAEQQIGVKPTNSMKLTVDEMSKLVSFSDALADRKMWIDDTTDLSVGKLLSRVMSMRHKGIDIVFVDYLQLMLTSGKSESRANEVAQISRGLKLLAKTVGVPVVAVSQLNRKYTETIDWQDIEDDDDLPVPQLFHLRESGAIEMDADAVILLARTPRPNADRSPVKARIHIAKQRFGVSGVLVDCWWDPRRLQFLGDCELQSWYNPVGG